MNEKNSITQSATKLKALECVHRNPEHLMAAPSVPQHTVPEPQVELQGQLPQHPQADISQYHASVPQKENTHRPPQVQTESLDNSSSYATMSRIATNNVGTALDASESSTAPSCK